MKGSGHFCSRCVRRSGADAMTFSDMIYVPAAARLLQKYASEGFGKRKSKVGEASSDTYSGCEAKATKIQLLWKQHKNRFNAPLNQEREKDAHPRSKMSYKIACYFGRGPLLENDTPQEAVLKKVPKWAQGTLLDIVKHRCITFDFYTLCSILWHWQVARLLSTHPGSRQFHEDCGSVHEQITSFLDARTLELEDSALPCCLLAGKSEVSIHQGPGGTKAVPVSK